MVIFFVFLFVFGIKRNLPCEPFLRSLKQLSYPSFSLFFTDWASPCLVWGASRSGSRRGALEGSKYDFIRGSIRFVLDAVSCHIKFVSMSWKGKNGGHGKVVFKKKFLQRHLWYGWFCWKKRRTLDQLWINYNKLLGQMSNTMHSSSNSLTHFGVDF